MNDTISILVGVAGVPLVQLIKNKFGLVDRAAQWLAFVVALALAVGVMAYQGNLGLAIETPDALIETLAPIFTSGFFAYRLLLKGA